MTTEAETTETPEAAGDEQAQQMQAPPFMIMHQFMKDLSFENPYGEKIFRNDDFKPDIKIKVDVTAQNLEGRDFEVSLHLSAESHSNETLTYMVELVYSAIVRVGDIPPEHLQPLLLIEIPRQTFPFARNILADAVREGGYEMVMLAPIDFGHLYQQKFLAMQEAEKQAEADGATNEDAS